MFTTLLPDSIPRPLAPYSHGIVVPAGMRMVFCAGQVGIGMDGFIPPDCAGQARLCFSAIEAILREAGMDFGNVVKLNAYVTAREHLRPYMDVRNSLFAEPYPASTLMIVSGFARAEFVVEIEGACGGAGLMARKIWWADFAAPDFASVDPDKTIAILPVAAIEQHGPHLPVGTDSLNQGCLSMLVERTPDDLDLRILPIQTAGKSNEHIWQTGTVTHTSHTLIDAWTEIGLSVARAGIRKLVFINSHGGNEEIMGIVARELRVRANMLAVKSSWSRFGTPDGMLDDIEKRHGIHGGDMETSLMLHFRPELVVHKKVENFISITARDDADFKYLKPTGQHAYAWIASDLNPNGVVGNAAKATAERGKLMAEHQVTGMLDLLRDVERYPLFAEGGTSL